MNSITHSNQKVDKAVELYINMPEDLFDFMFQNFCDFENGKLEADKKEKLDEFDPNWMINVPAAVKWAIKNERR
jgi:hypothetical protein